MLNNEIACLLSSTEGSFVSFRFVVLPSYTYLFTVEYRRFVFSLDHTQTHTTVAGTHLDEGSTRRRDL
jgi:hypothetical protein